MTIFLTHFFSPLIQFFLGVQSVLTNLISFFFKCIYLLFPHYCLSSTQPYAFYPSRVYDTLLRSLMTSYQPNGYLNWCHFRVSSSSKLLWPGLRYFPWGSSLQIIFLFHWLFSPCLPLRCKMVNMLFSPKYPLHSFRQYSCQCSLSGLCTRSHLQDKPWLTQPN